MGGKIFKIEPRPDSPKNSHSPELCGKLKGVEKRSLRVGKWLGTVPAIGVCTRCSRTFKVPLDSLKRTSDAQESLRKQFAEHKCKLVDGSQDAGRTVPESTEDK